MSMNTLKCSSRLSTGSFRAPNVVGTFLIPRAGVVTAFVSVARYFTTSHESAGWAVPRGMPTIVPPI